MGKSTSDKEFKNSSRSILKLIQLKLYSFLSSRFGMALCIIGAFISFNTVFQLVRFYTDHSTNNNTPIITNKILNRNWDDNVGGISYQDLLCSPPIDIVYTWVNGSDPKLTREVNELKRSLRDPLMPECTDKQNPEKDKCYRDDNTASRFVDNQELKYSLRSIEKYAPWIRHIYIITNGQVPNWLNLANPKISIVTHSDIFVNKSHLPTFSSPSIETHLHRIPGLSKKFIYLNDDVMFGREIYPDDFLTQSGGQRVFLSWPVPNCNEGCPNNWIGDGFCDQACNVSTCEFDAGDCNNSTGTVKTRWWNRNNNANNGNNVNGVGTNTAGGTNTANGGTVSNTNDRLKTYCSRGCPDSWVGDKHCDRMCKNEDCGFDAGDCGVEIMYSSMKGYEVTLNTSLIPLPDRTYSIYFNLSTLIGNGTITDGSHDNAVLVRTATISQKFKIMTLTFHKNKEFQNVAISISYEQIVTPSKQSIDKDGKEIVIPEIKETIEKNFNLTLSTKEEISTDSNSNSGSSVNSTTTITTPHIIGVDPNSILNNNNEEEQVNDNNNSGNSNITDIIEATNAEIEFNGKQTKKQNNKQEIFIEANGQTVSDPLANKNDYTSGLPLDDNTDNNKNKKDKSTNSSELFDLANQVGKDKAEEIFNDFVGNIDQKRKEQGGNNNNNDNNNINSNKRNILSIEIDNSTGDENDNEFTILNKKQKEQEEQEQVEEEEQIREQILKRKEIELKEYYDQVTELMEEEKKYKLNKETTDRLIQEGEIYPWEELIEDEEESNGNGINGVGGNGGKRKLLDMFGDSLKFVNRLYSKEFGSSPRKVPAHMPHMIDVDVMYEIQSKWPVQWDHTSSHSLRHPQDMQYAFSFFYYLIHKKQSLDVDRRWSTEWDIDADGELNDNELRTLSVNVYGVPIKPSQWKSIKNHFFNICTNYNLNQRLNQLLLETTTSSGSSNNGISSSGGTLVVEQNTEQDNIDNISSLTEIDEIKSLLQKNHSLLIPNIEDRPQCKITLDVIKSDNKTMEDIKKAYSKKNYYKTTIDGTDEVAFLMLDNNDTIAQGKLDGVRQKRHKFICLNDNINHTNPNTKNVVQVLHDFYASLFPLPCQFELPPGQFNQFLYIDEFKTVQKEIRVRSYSSYYLIVSVSLFLLYFIWKCKISTSFHKSKSKRNLSIIKGGKSTQFVV